MPVWNKIEIPKEKLEDLYLKRRLSIAQIAKTLNCSTEPVHESLREYKIPIRNLSEACTKASVTKNKLKDWYHKDKLSMDEIARRLGLSNHTAIVYKFKKLGIKSRGHLGLTKPIKLTKRGFEYLYYERGLSLKKMAKIVRCSESGLERRFKNYNLKSRGIKNRACKYKKKDFSGNLVEKAYLIGFRLGDLNVTESINVIQVRCSTTIPAQVRLIKKLFMPYTTPHIWKAKRGTTEIVCLVNRSFDFLLPKKDLIPRWIQNNKELFFSFLAGYTDAEGSFYIKKSKEPSYTPFGMLEIQTQQKNIIIQIWRNLQNLGITSQKPQISRKTGVVLTNGNKNNKDIWRITLARKEPLFLLLRFLQPYLRHEEKIKDAEKVMANLISRNRKFKLSNPYHPSLGFA